MTTITNTSFIFYEVIDIKATNKRVSVFESMGYSRPKYISRKLYESTDGRLFVAYNKGFCEVRLADDGYSLMHGGGQFTRGVWHFEDEKGWVTGSASMSEVDDSANADNANEAMLSDAETTTNGDGEFNLLEMFGLK